MTRIMMEGSKHLMKTIRIWKTMKMMITKRTIVTIADKAQWTSKRKNHKAKTINATQMAVTILIIITHK